MVYNIYLWDDCCHQWVSQDSGLTFVESVAPDGGNPPVSTVDDDWPDAQMAINDADYLTFVGVDSEQGSLNEFGILAISFLAGTGTTFVLNDPEKSTTGIPPSPAFMPASDPQFGVDWQTAFGCAITANAKIILVCVNDSSASTTPFYPRISRDSGNTWNDVTVGLPASQPWARAAFSKSGTIMYLQPDNSSTWPAGSKICQSIDAGMTWNALIGGPLYDAGSRGGEQRIRCSANGQIVVSMDRRGIFWISKDAGISWSTFDFPTISGIPVGIGSGDCGITPDGNTIIVGLSRFINGGTWPAIYLSKDAGTTFSDLTSRLQYPASVGPPVGGAPGTNQTSFTQCNVAPDGNGLIVTYNYKDNIVGDFSKMYVNVSTDGGATFVLRSFTCQAFNASVGNFTGIYMMPFTSFVKKATSLIMGMVQPLPKPKYAYSFLLARECNPKGL